MLFKFTFLFFLSFNLFSYDQELVINVPAGERGESYYLTGDFCDWKPDCLKLGELDNFSIKFPLYEAIKQSKVKVTKGSWDSEACDKNSRPLNNIELSKRKKLQVINIVSWCDEKKAKGEKVYFYYFFKSINKYRRVDVYIPSGFKQGPNDSSFILFLDGQNVFDSNRSAFGYEWRADEAAEGLKIEDKILVSIDNGGRYRTEEYHYFKKGKDFSQEIANDFINSLCEEFLNKEKCDGNIIAGSSLGALFAFTTSFTHPEVFSKSISLSFPAFAYDNYVFKFIKQQRKLPPKENLFYFDFGGFGQDANYEEPFERFISESIIQKLSIKWKKFPYHGHNELNWSQRLPFIFENTLTK